MNNLNQRNFILELEDIIESRIKANEESSYTAHLLQKGKDKVLQKVGEEAVEYILEAKNTNKQRIISEGADLLYHFIVSLKVNDLTLNDIGKELNKRHNK
jgi:phosphoribosyl-ATP pyrophosphohydrolase